MKPVSHTCDAQARAGLWIVIIVGSMGLSALWGLFFLAYTKREPSPVVLTAFSGAIGAAMAGLPSLLARMSGTSEPQVPSGTKTDPVHAESTIVNERDNPVPMKEVKP